MNTHAGRIGGAVSGSIPYTGVPPGTEGGSTGRTVVVPYAYPVFYGGGYGYGGYYRPGASGPERHRGCSAAAAAAGRSSTTRTSRKRLNLFCASIAGRTAGIQCEGIRRSVQASQRTALRLGRSIMDQKPTIYLVALKDGTIRQAIGYWVRANVFHYVTPNSSDESRVDRYGGPGTIG